MNDPHYQFDENFAGKLEAEKLKILSKWIIIYTFRRGATLLRNRNFDIHQCNHKFPNRLQADSSVVRGSGTGAFSAAKLRGSVSGPVNSSSSRSSFRGSAPGSNLSHRSTAVAGAESNVPDSRAVESSDNVVDGSFNDPQNGGGQFDVVGGDDERHQTTTFIDQEAGMKIEYPVSSNEVVDTDYQENVELANYLSRPVRIYNFIWNESDTIGTGTTITPWLLFLNTTSIKNKLQNYPFLRADLHIKIIINASPFYFGAMLFNYVPLQGFNNTTVKTDSKNTQFIPLSQQPHVWVYPQTNQGGEIVCPFFYHKNWLDITNSTTVSNFGALTYTINQILDSANGVVGTGVYVTVYAWMENVRFLGTTNKAALQAEFSRGAISKPASVVAAASKALSNIPIIGHYAKATEMAASAVSNIATHFGYTNTPNINDSGSVKLSPFPHLASTEISTPIERLAIDPKNELSISGNVAGTSDQDEMNIQYIISRESYLVSFPWTTATPVDRVLFQCRVTSMLSDMDTTAANPIVNSTPLGYISNLFKFWRGDIIFRFRVVCTSYHKGRLILTFDPRQGSNAVVESSTVFAQVIDIGQSNDIEFRVPYMSEYAWLKTRKPTYVTSDTIAIPYIIGNGSTQSLDLDTDFGMLNITVLNPLTAPISSSSINIQVFVRAGENFEFALPYNNALNINYYTLQADMVSFETPSNYDLGATKGGCADNRYLHNMGEAVPSLRKLLHRTFYVETVMPANVNTTSQLAIYKYNHCRLPCYYGYDPNGYSSAKGTLVPLSNFPFNFVTTHPISWIAPMYIGYRGSVNWTYNLSWGTQVVPDYRVFRSNNTRSTAQFNVTTLTAAASASSYARQFSSLDNAASGIALTHQRTQAGISANFPYYSRANFSLTNPLNNNVGVATDDSNIDTMSLIYIMSPVQQGDISTHHLDKYFSTGFDFNLFFFLNCPSFYVLGFPTPN